MTTTSKPARKTATPATAPVALGIVAPSGRLPDAAIADRAAAFFAKRGWRVQAGESVFAQHTRFAGEDALRVADLNRFATDASLDVVLAARGGFGLTRLLADIDYEGIAKAGRILVGYSDFTALNLALLARTGAVSFQGPSAVDFGADTPDRFAVQQFFATIGAARHALAFRTSAADLSVRGTLWGGNLALMCALLGTPYFPDVKGGILFIEDVNEPAYRVERMLLQLLQAGVLARQRAIVLGRFEPMPVMHNDYGYELRDALARIRSALRVPIVQGLPFGHVPRKATLPVGARGQLVVSGRRAELSFSGHPYLR